MLAIISDLHLQHTSEDEIRYRDEDGVVRALVVERNVDVRALQRFFSMLHERAMRCDARRVHLVLAGDIFEIHRSPRWLDSRSGLVRPYDEVDEAGLQANKALEKRVNDILDDIIKENCAFLTELKGFATSGVYRFSRDPRRPAAARSEPLRFHDRAGRPMQMELHYLPGNHDRLVNAWDSTREKVRRCLGMGGGSARFPHWLDTVLNKGGDSHEARIRHGHEYDAVNFPAPVRKDGSVAQAPANYVGPCFGDYATVDVAARLALAFRVHNAARLRQADMDECRKLYMKLTEFDDVRPASELGTYLLERKDAEGTENARWLLPALRDVCGAARANPFVEREVSRLKLGLGLADEAIAALAPILAATPAWGLYPLIRAVTWLVSGHKSQAGPEVFAAREAGLGSKARFVVAGHTHYPAVAPLPPADTGECFYLDTGTWRNTVPYGVGCFGHLRAYTMVFVYSSKERERVGRDDRRFETWTGHLVPKRSGDHPQAETLCAAPKPQRIVFTRLDVAKIPEDGIWFARGAELELHFGADGTECSPFRQKVKARKDPYSLGDVAVALDQELDGEVWCRAVERDVAVDDILPWALHRLPRNKDGNFSQKPGKLLMEDAGTKMVLHYRVEDVPQPPPGP